MPDKELTDSEITKILEYCANFGNCEYCSMIPPNGIKKGTLGCFSSLIKFALNVIEAKEKEKEKMRYHLADATVRFTALEKETKSEAYKEFAENAVERVGKSRQKYERLCKEQGEQMEEAMHIHFDGIIGIINNLLKELVGEDK